MPKLRSELGSNVHESRWNTHIPVNSIESIDLLGIPCFLEIFEKVVLPLESSDAFSHERIDIILDVRQKHVQSTQLTLYRGYQNNRN